MLNIGVENTKAAHELWFHDCLGWFAVRLEKGQVTGICGPIPDATALDCDPSAFFYDEGPEAIQRERESPEQFMSLEEVNTSSAPQTVENPAGVIVPGPAPF